MVGFRVRKRTKKVNYRCPKWAAAKFLDKAFLASYGLKTFNELYHYLIVSGIVFLKQDIITFLDSNVGKYRQKFKDSRQFQPGKVYNENEKVKPNFEPFTQLRADLLEEDFEAFGRFCIEKNYKPVWIYHTLFVDGFLSGNEIFLNHVKNCIETKINMRRTKLNTLSKSDKMIDVFSEAESKKILEHLTIKYDNNDFSKDLLIEEMSNLQKSIKKEEDQKAKEDELDAALNKKMREVRSMKNKEVDELLEPVILDESEE